MKHTPIARLRSHQIGGWRRHAIALACLATLANSARADASQDGGVTPWFQSAPVVSLPGSVIDVGNRMPGDAGWVRVNSGGRLTAGGMRVYSGGFDVWDSGSFVELVGADRSLWVAHGGNSGSWIFRGGQVQATGGCIAGHCDLLVGGTAGLRYTGDLANGYPFSPANRATGYLTVENAGSRLAMDGVLRVGRAWVDAAGGENPRGVTGGTAAGVVNLYDGASLQTGAAGLAIGPSGPGRSGTEQAFAAVNLAGASRWDIVRNATSGTQAMLTLGVRGEGGVVGDRLQAHVQIWSGSTLFVDGRGGGTNPGIVLADGGLVSHGLLQVGGTGSQLVIAGNTGFINLGGSGGSAGGWGGLFVSNGAQVRGEGDSGLVFVSVGRNGSEVKDDQRAFGELRVDGAGSLLALSGRDQTTGPGRGQSAFLSIGRSGAGGSVGVTNGAHIVVDAPAYADGVTTTGAGFAIARDAGSFGDLSIQGPGSALTVRSSDRRPFVAVGQNGEGMLHIGEGGRVDLLSGNAFASGPNSLLYVGGGGNGQSRAYGWLNIHGGGSLVQGPDNDNTLIAGSAATGTAGAFGRIDVHNRGQLTTTALLLGVGALGEAQMSIDNAEVLLRGEQTQAATSGAAVSVGRGGGRGELHLRNQALLTINSAGSFAGLALGGTVIAPGGVGSMTINSGARLEVLSRGRNDHGMWIGRAGTGTLYIGEGSRAIVEAAGRVIIGAVDDAVGQLRLGPGAELTAGRLLLVGGNETPLADGSGLVHANDWQPLGLNQVAITGQGASGYLHASGSRVIAEHVGLGLAAGSKGMIEILDASSLEVGRTMMVGALGQGGLSVSGATATILSADARLWIGADAGGAGGLRVDNGGALQLPGVQALAVIGRHAGSSGNVEIDSGRLALEGPRSELVVGGGGSAVVDLRNGATLRAARLTIGAGSGSSGRVTLAANSIVEIGSTDRSVPAAVVLGAAADSVGELDIRGANAALRLSASGQAGLFVGNLGQGTMRVENGASVELRVPAGNPVAAISVGGSPQSLLQVDASSRLALSGPGNFLGVSMGKSVVNGEIALRLAAAPSAAISYGHFGRGEGELFLPQTFASQGAQPTYVSLRYDGYRPGKFDYVPLFSAGTIRTSGTMGLTPYREVTLGDKSFFEFGVGSGLVNFRIEKPAPGLYPALERTMEAGAEVWGIRYVDQAAFIDFDTASSLRLTWRRLPDSGLYQVTSFGKAAEQAVAAAPLSSENRADLLAEFGRALWGRSQPVARGSDGEYGLRDAIALPFFESSTTAQAPLNALVARFAAGPESQRPQACADNGCRKFEMLGFAFDTASGILSLVDLQNVRKDGEVVVFADDSWFVKQPDGLRGARPVAGTLLHEIGHGLGLLHVDSAPNGSGLMAPTLGKDIAFHDQPLPLHDSKLGLTQNSMLHLYKYTFGWSDERLAQFGAEPGTADGDLASFLYGVDVLLDLTKPIFDYVLLQPAFAGLEGGWLPVQSGETLGAGVSRLSFTTLSGLPFRVYAASEAGDTFDLFFEASPGASESGIGGEALAQGRIVRYDPVSGAAVQLGTYSFVSAPHATPVPEPATWGSILLGLGTLAFVRRRARRRLRH